MTSIIQDMVALAEQARGRGLPTEWVVFSMNKEGLNRFLKELTTVPDPRAVIASIRIEFHAEQKPPVMILGQAAAWAVPPETELPHRSRGSKP
jgi:hypothetical protein